MQNGISKQAEWTLLAVACLTIMVGCAIVPGLSSIAESLGMTGLESWLVTMPSVGVVVLGPIAGNLVDRVGLRRSLIVGLFLYGALGLAGAMLRGPYVVLADRFLLGGATALVMTTGTGLISAFYEDQRRLTMIARQGMAIELGGVVFLMIGGWLATQGWWLPFLQYAIAWVMLGFVVAFVPDERVSRSASIGSQDGSLPSAVRSVYFAAFFSMGCFFAAVILLPLRFHEMGIGAAATGYFLAFVSLVAVGVASVMPRVVSRLGANTVLRMAFVTYAIAHALFASAAALPTFIAGAIALGCGFGLSIPLVNHMTVQLSPSKRRGRALATLSMAIFAGQCLPSFMHYEPGNASRFFLAACAVAIVAGLGLPIASRVLGGSRESLRR